MSKPNTQSQDPNQDQRQPGKPSHGNDPIDPVVDPIETEQPDEPGELDDTIEPEDPVRNPIKSGGMNDPDNPSDNTLASAGDYYEEPVMEQAGDDLEQLKLNPGDKGTQAHQGHVYSYTWARGAREARLREDGSNII